jgi:hypothetical protein
MRSTQINKYLQSIGSLKSMLNEYSDDCKIDFGDRYIVRLISNDTNVISVEWIGKPEQDAIYAAKEKEEAEKQWTATSLSIEQSSLNNRLKGLLTGAGIKTIYELAQNFPEELNSTIRGFGWKSISSVEEELARHGWRWGGSRIEEKMNPKENDKCGFLR